MARYCTHTLILPDESRLDDMVLEVAGSVVAYYPFTGELHSTLYVDNPILLSHRPDLEGKTVSLTQLAWALVGEADDTLLYAYELISCPLCVENRFLMRRL